MGALSRALETAEGETRKSTEDTPLFPDLFTWLETVLSSIPPTAARPCASTRLAASCSRTELIVRSLGRQQRRYAKELEGFSLGWLLCNDIELAWAERLQVKGIMIHPLHGCRLKFRRDDAGIPAVSFGPETA